VSLQPASNGTLFQQVATAPLFCFLVGEPSRAIPECFLSVLPEAFQDEADRYFAAQITSYLLQAGLIVPQ